MKIAIIDGVNQDIGLKILFPEAEADYFINNTEVDKTESLKKYNIIPQYDWSTVNDKNYDYLFIIISLYDAKLGTKFFKQNIYDILNRENEIINNNNFKKIFVFDNYDYDYDPNEIWKNEKISFFFKRNYNKKKVYGQNVIPFPFIMFGDVSLIEKCDTEMVSKEQYFENKINRVFFSGTLFNHQDAQYGFFRNRNIIYSQICNTVYNRGHLNYLNFINEIRNSKFSLDLLGVGEPNKRTFEILLSGSLLLSEKNELKWPFEEEFCEETIFSNKDEYLSLLNLLNNNSNIYEKCLEQQYKIANQYFNIKWVKEYILNKIK